ncbi:MAG: tryptophan/tyrosine permease [Gammaproteobacteria bacterium]|nr:tryptophan/tyrosine permease [Gammaproteobacteria bacterium]
MSKLFGGSLLIAGTCIGGGMLGLPIATAKSGVLGSSVLFIICWMLMTFTALLTLEVNLCFPKESNMISMAKATLGKSGEIICWTVYLFFLYALVSAYIAGGQDVLHGLLALIGIDAPIAVCAFIFVGVFGAIVMAGVKHVDLFNRLLMMIKLLTIFVLIFFIVQQIDLNNYITSKPIYVLSAVTVAVTSFGFSIIVPSLRNYFDDNIKQLRLAIVIGSILPLLCYIMWNTAIFGSVPLQGDFGLERLQTLDQPITGLLASLQHFVPQQTIIMLARGFTSICVLTAFACVSLGLADYLADGFKVKAESKARWGVMLATFIPPIGVVLFYPQAFIMLLGIAGLLCLILQALMPVLMAWRCRYVNKIEGSYQVFGGKPLLILASLTSLIMIFIASYQMIYREFI